MQRECHNWLRRFVLKQVLGATPGPASTSGAAARASGGVHGFGLLGPFGFGFKNLGSNRFFWPPVVAVGCGGRGWRCGAVDLRCVKCRQTLEVTARLSGKEARGYVAHTARATTASIAATRTKKAHFLFGHFCVDPSSSGMLQKIRCKASGFWG